MKISHELKMKIITNHTGVNIEQQFNEVFVAGSIPIKIPLYTDIKLFLNFDNDLELFKECVKWYKLITDNYSLEMKLNVGYFIGLFPVEIDIMKNEVNFIADAYNENNQDWKDWFVMEEN